MHLLGALLLVTLSATRPPYVPPQLETVNRAGIVQNVFGESGLVGARFSPDRTKVAWAARDGVHLAGADGSNPRLVEAASVTCHTECTGMNVVWSPNGTELLISGGGPQTNALQTYSLASGMLKDVAPRLKLAFYQAVGFTSGGTPVYTRFTDRGDLDPYDLIAGSRIVYRFGSSHCQCGGLTLSPDGRRVAIAVETLHGNVIRVIDVRNGVAHDISGFSPAFGFAWSPDSTRIAFDNRVQGKWLVETVPASGGRPHVVGPGIAETWTREGEILVVRANYTQLWSAGRLVFRAPHDREIDWVDAT